MRNYSIWLSCEIPFGKKPRIALFEMSTEAFKEGPFKKEAVIMEGLHGAPMQRWWAEFQGQTGALKLP